MEKDRGATPSENNPENKLDKKKKRSKKASDFGIPVARLEEDTKKTESKETERTSFDEALAKFIIKEPKEAESKPKAEDVESEPEEAVEPEAATGELREEPEAANESAEATETNEAEEVYEELPNYEPEPTEFSGGEVIIDLNGEEPVSERVVLLRDPTPAEATTPANEEFQPPAGQSGLEQQQAEGPTVAAAEAQTENIETETAVMIQPEQTPVPLAEVIEPTPEPFRVSPENQFNTARVVPDAERVATKQDVEDAVYYATKAGQQRGLVTGLLVAGAYEHFKHRRREKKSEKRFKKQGKQLEAARQDYNFGLQEQERRQTEATTRLSAAERRFTGAEQANPPEKTVIRTPEQIAGENPQLVLPPEHSLQRSAWHSIEIDNRTGKAVENPTFEYGEEFHRERAKESLPDADQADKPASGALADLAAASAIPNASTDGGVTPPSNLPNATVQGPPSSRTDKAKSALQSLTKSKSDNSASSGPIWPWLLALVVVVLLLIILL
jgi:hypothetical protein